MPHVNCWRLPFEFGASGALHIRQETVRLGLAWPVRLLYASDLHLGRWWTQCVPEQLLDAARQASPDVILLGGDLADRPRALADLHRLVRSLLRVAPVHAVPGNHDVQAGLRDVQAAVESAGGGWLPAHPANHPLHIDGTIDGAITNRPRLLCAHYPGVFPAALAAGYRLVLAGHLHGGQCVLATRRNKLYPAAWFDRWHGLRFRDGAGTMLVSRGVADTLPLRFNCPREVILCEIV
jgi:predicted MPP superfamily phosphohydrolase